MKSRTRRVVLGWAGVLASSTLVWGADIASAELQRVEAVGIFGIREATRSRFVPRDEAVAMARWEGVSRVALEIIGEAAPSNLSDGEGDSDSSSLDGSGARGGSTGDRSDPDAGSEDREQELRKALGKDLLPYIRSYRIIEDRGEVPVLFDESPDVKVEYVVVVEVIVDVDRVTRTLENAGMIARIDPVATSDPVIIELVGLSRYDAFEAVLTALRDQLGAKHVQTVEFATERQVVSVEVPFGPDTLSARLAGFESQQLSLEPLAIDLAGRRIRMLGRWFEAPPPASDPHGGGSRAPRS